MAASSFDAALARVLAHEGGYSNHPSDPGGPTKFGITLADYRRHLKPGATAADVRAMRLDEARAIYRAHYWAALRCDELPPGLDYALFDYGVNSGIGRAARVLQRLLGFADDGRISAALLAAVRKRAARELIARLCDERLAFLRRLRTWPVFGAGWGRRVAQVRTVALSMAEREEKGRAPAGPASAGAAPSSGKGVAPANKGAQRGTAGGVVVAGSVAAQQAHQAGLRPLVIAAIVLVTVALAAGCWLAWRWRQRRIQHASI
jgi:lysozyme family protein